MGKTPQPLVIAAPRSGSGKTTVALGLMAALRARGQTVAPFKVGPDFIDPGFHAMASGRSSRNLDGWMCGRSWVTRAYIEAAQGADLAVIEGVMGLFDGADGGSDAGSTAEITRWLEGRVVLVVDAGSQARSAAALVQGFVRFDPELEYGGVIFNRVGGDRHRQHLQEAMESVSDLPPVFGYLPRDEFLTLPERHLGLVTAAESGLDPIYWERLSAWMERHIDLGRLLQNQKEPVFSHHRPGNHVDSLFKAEGRAVKIGVARDDAFCFCYPDNLELLEKAGADLVFFSPLEEQKIPEGVDGLYLPGGYPELAADRLAENIGLLETLRRVATAGMPIYAECGGLMLLAESIDGRPMAGVFPGAARMLPRRKALGYREVTLTEDAPLGPAGTVARGHEFHYSELDLSEAVARCYRLSGRGGAGSGREGYRVHNTLGSYVHLHFGSNPRVAANFVEFCWKNRCYRDVATETQSHGENPQG